MSTWTKMSINDGQILSRGGVLMATLSAVSLKVKHVLQNDSEIPPLCISPSKMKMHSHEIAAVFTAAFLKSKKTPQTLNNADVRKEQR